MVGKEVFYAALWGSVLASPSVRLPASLFVVAHISRDLPGKEQKYMLGTDYQLTVGAVSPPGRGRWPGPMRTSRRWAAKGRQGAEGKGVRACNAEESSQMRRRRRPAGGNLRGWR